MQELTTDIDSVMSILRSKPDSYFTYKSITSAIKISESVLEKWILLLEHQKKVVIKYDMASDIKFKWIGGQTEIETQKKILKKETSTEIIRTKSYSSKDINFILEEIRDNREILLKLLKRKEYMVKKNSADNTTITMIDMRVSQKKKNLASLILQAKRVCSS